MQLSFGRCQLNLAARELTVDGDLVDLQPMVFDLLAFFAQHPGRVVSKSELLQIVWRSPVVTDSVVARAVMKARRAIMDDARAPMILRTVQRNGYRFDGQVVHQDQPPDLRPTDALSRLPGLATFDLAVLTWAGLGPDSGPWGSQVACLVHHLLERTGTLALLPMADVLFNKAYLQPSGDGMATACSLFGSREVVSFEMVRGALGTWHLVMLRGPSHAAARQWAFEGLDPWALALRAVHALSPTTALGGCTGDAPPGWAQLGQALYLEQAGVAAEAKALAEQAHALLGASAWVDLVLARLNWKATHPQQALDLIATALTRPEASGSVDLQVQLLHARGMAHERRSELADACAAFEQAHNWASKPNPAYDMRSEILGLWGQMHLRLGRPEHGRRLAEQGVLRATAMGHAFSETSAKLRLALILLLMQQVERAADVVQQAVKLADNCCRPSLQANALRVQSLTLLSMRRFGTAIEAARKGQAQYTAVGQAAMAASCHTNLYLALIESDQFEMALQERDQMALINPEVQRAFEVFSAVLDWKLDRHDAANSTFQRHTVRNGPSATPAQHECAMFLARNLVYLGRLDEARQVLACAEDDPSTERPLLIKADLAFAQGERAACIALLRQIWLTVKQRNEYVMDACIDLAWLLLEDHGPQQGDEELESLVAHLMDYSDDYPAALLMTAAYLLRSMPTALTRARWDSAVRHARAFSRRYPDMTTPAFRDALEHGRAPLAPRLLTRLCQ